MPSISREQQVRRGRLFLVLFIFIFAGLVIWVKSAVQDPASAPPVATKKATNQESTRQVLLIAGFEKGFIAIKNENTFDWTNAKITVANGATSQYNLSVGTIKSGETKSYRLSDFVSLDGEIYDSRKYVPKQVLVNADNASGGRQY